MVGVGELGLPDGTEVVDGGESVQRRCPPQQKVLDVLQTVGGKRSQSSAREISVRQTDGGQIAILSMPHCHSHTVPHSAPRHSRQLPTITEAEFFFKQENSGIICSTMNTTFIFSCFLVYVAVKTLHSPSTCQE